MARVSSVDTLSPNIRADEADGAVLLHFLPALSVLTYLESHSVCLLVFSWLIIDRD